MNYKNISEDKKIGILDWAILIAVMLLVILVYIPQSIWAEEDQDRSESRWRMQLISNAAEFYNEMTGEYTTDGKFMFKLVEAAIDSSLADSLFYGSQTIFIDDNPFSVTLEDDFDVRADTTFSESSIIRVSVLDSIYIIGMKNETEQNLVDTMYVNSRTLKMYENKDSFLGIFSLDTIRRVENTIDYLRKKYHLTDNLLLCPLTNNPYILSIKENKDNNKEYKVQSPVPVDYSDSRYIFFKYKAGNHGNITAGNPSWAE